MADRTYNEKEVAVLLERAAEMQARAARRTEHRPGLTLSELEAVASEAGLDPSLLRHAAAELDQPHHTLLSRNSGMTSAHVFVERRVPGALTPEVWEDVVAEMRHHFDSDFAAMMGIPKYGVGTTEQIGRTLEWRHTSSLGVETKLMIRPKEDELHLRMSQRVGVTSPPIEGSAYGFLIALVAGLITGGILDSAGIGVAVFLVSLLAAIPLIIYADDAWRKKKLRELDSLADRVTSIVAVPVEDAIASDARTAHHVIAAEEGTHEQADATSGIPGTLPRIDSSSLHDDDEDDDDGNLESGHTHSRRRSRG